MAELTFECVFHKITSTVTDEPFSAMYFGRHHGKNVLVLKHELTVILAFTNDIQGSNPDFIKPVSTRGEPVNGIKIVGNGDVILMLDEGGNLWRLINAFESSDTSESLHSLSNSCFYEWVPFRKFGCTKVLDICAMKNAFACIGINKKQEKKLAVLLSTDLSVEEFTFDGLTTSESFSYYLVYLDINTENPVMKNKLDFSKETFLITDRFEGRTYLCTKDGKSCLINQSNISLISALHYSENKCVILCFENGKLVFYFYDEPNKQCVVYLPRKLIIIEKCCCFDFCVLWSDGIYLNHSKFTLGDNSTVRVSHLRCGCALQTPLALLRIPQSVLVATINNIYYLVGSDSAPAAQIKTNPKELLYDLNESSRKISELEMSIDMLSHYLLCKDIMESCNMEEKIEMRWEGNCLVLKWLLRIRLRHEFWKLRLKLLADGKELVHLVDFKFDVGEGMCIMVENPFKCKEKIKVSLIGDFGGTELFLNLGEIGSPEGDSKNNQLSKHLENILSKRNPGYLKKTEFQI